jgi:Domain of unknown function (DUF5076)
MAELPLPDQIDKQSDAELLRVWTIDGLLAVRSNPGVHTDPAFYGVVLADLVSHLAQITARVSGLPPAQCKADIISAFDRELHPNE